MDMTSATFAFAALAQPTRLEVFGLLVKAGPDGMAAGEIADALGVRQNTMSANLAVLLRAGLVTNRREGRTIRYHADIAAMAALIGFLVTDCCGGKPEHCAPLLNLVAVKTTCEC
jgi:DNA-binding transcriptional ArsR family regulator